MNSFEDAPEQDAIDDMLSDLELDPAREPRLRSALTDIRAQAMKVPVASAEVVALLQGATPLRRSHRRLVVAAAAGVLAFGGASAAAAANRLPDSLQEVVANMTGHLPVSAPHPDDSTHVKPAGPIIAPTDAPSDAPGQLRDTSDGDTLNHDNSDAPGLIQKDTKPDTHDPGPAEPADPGSHGREHAAVAQTDHADHDRRGHNGGKAEKSARSKDSNDSGDDSDDHFGSSGNHGKPHDHGQG